MRPEARHAYQSGTASALPGQASDNHFGHAEFDIKDRTNAKKMLNNFFNEKAEKWRRAISTAARRGGLAYFDADGGNKKPAQGRLT
jgi:hypothetical protein